MKLRHQHDELSALGKLKLESDTIHSEKAAKYQVVGPLAIIFHVITLNSLISYSLSSLLGVNFWFKKLLSSSGGWNVKQHSKDFQKKIKISNPFFLEILETFVGLKATNSV